MASQLCIKTQYSSAFLAIREISAFIAEISYYIHGMIQRKYLANIKRDLEIFKVVALLGPRQVGKTTLARQYCSELENFPWETNFLDLEDPTALARLSDPKLALAGLQGLTVIDEIQLRPELFPVLRYLLDRPSNQLQLLVLGSASRDLIKQSSESLAGRITYIEVCPLELAEVGHPHLESLWLRGGLPPAFLARTDEQAFQWLHAYTRTYLERDIPSLGITIPSDTLRRFWMMLVHNHANVLNVSELGRSFGVADTTARRYLDILSGTFMIRQLKPYHVNIKKRQVKASKVYFRDSGVLHALMNVKSHSALSTHIKCGASWEGFALEEMIRRYQVPDENCYFWAVHQQGELDLLLEIDNRLQAFEFKYSSAPELSKSMELALRELPIDEISVIAPVESGYRLSSQVRVLPL